MKNIFKISIIFVCLVSWNALAKDSPSECTNRRMALSTFVSACAGWKAVYQSNRGDSYEKQKRDCREISKEFADLIAGVAQKGCDFTYQPNLVHALMKDKDVKAFDSSL